MPEYSLRAVLRLKADSLEQIDTKEIEQAIRTHVPLVTDVVMRTPAEVRHPPGRAADERLAAESWLRAWLTHNQPAPSALVFSAAEKSGITRRTLRRAADSLGVVRDPPKGGSKTTWSLAPTPGEKDAA
jgi:hypothetical protein